MKIGVIFIGGSLKGIYGHTGVVAALRKLNVTPSVILGASAGSVIGSFMAAGMSDAVMSYKMTHLHADDFLDKMSRFEILKEFIFHHAKNFTGFVAGDKVEEYVHTALGEKDDFSKLEIPFYVAVTNLKDCKLQLFSTGAVSEKCRASTAIPMLFKPKKINGQFFIDGALLKTQLPIALHEVAPDLDLIIVSNLSYEHRTDDNSYLEDSDLPLVEIMRRVLDLKELSKWPKRLGHTKVYILEPGMRTPVDIFHPAKNTAKAVYEEAKVYAEYHLGRCLRRLYKKQKPKTE